MAPLFQKAVDRAHEILGACKYIDKKKLRYKFRFVTAFLRTAFYRVKKGQKNIKLKRHQTI